MSVYDEVKAERDYQDKKWGHVNDDTKNTPWMWVAYIVQYAGSWLCGSYAPLGTNTTNAFRLSMIKVAAIAIAAVESVDRQRKENGKCFFE